MNLNYSTSSVGYVQVVLTDEQGKEILGIGEQDAKKMAGDKIDEKVLWSSGKSLRELDARKVHIKFILKDADLFSFRVWE